MEEPPGTQKLYLGRTVPPTKVVRLGDKEQSNWTKEAAEYHLSWMCQRVGSLRPEIISCLVKYVFLVLTTPGTIVGTHEAYDAKISKISHLPHRPQVHPWAVM